MNASAIPPKGPAGLPVTEDTQANPVTQPPAVERLAGTAHAAIDQAAAKAGPMVDKVREKVQDVNLASDQWVQQCRERVRQHPLSAVAFGLAAGWLLGKVGGRPPRM